MNTLRRITLSAIAAAMAISMAMAQSADTPITISCLVTKVTKNGAQNSQVQYAVFNKVTTAQKVRNSLVGAIAKVDALGATGNELEDAMRASGQKWKESQPNGVIKERVMSGQAIVVLCDQQEVDYFEVRPGQTEYSLRVEMKRSLGEVNVTAKRMKRGMKIDNVPPTDDGKYLHIPIKFELPEGWVRDDTRLIIQPMIVECQTEDTVAYINPIVYEGNEYHMLQDRRMRFDYHSHDVLQEWYKGGHPIGGNEPLVVDTTIIYPKPDKKKDYKAIYYLVLVDYHSDYYNNGGEGTGSCLSFKPFKLLDLSITAADLNLADFRVEAESQYTTIPRNLKLNFDVGSDRLTADSINDVELQRLISELKSYGSRLFRVSVEGSASPEGNYESNKALAARRAARAMSIIRSSLGNADVQLPTPTVHVYTWDDVVIQLAATCSDTAIVATVRHIVQSNNSRNVYAALKQLPYFDTHIQPVLVNQRIMKCSYSYERDHVMTPQEAVEAYHRFKDEYISGKRRFSDGDYYNLFATITDSAELDVITELAYKQITQQPSYEMLTFSPYVANRMAMLNMRRGATDLGVLAPFIDTTDARVPAVTYDMGVKVTKNLPAIVINQAIAYFQEEEIDTAQALINMVQDDEAAKRINQFIQFKRYFIKYITGQCTPEEKAICDEAYNYVVESSAENKAILYAETHRRYLNMTRQEVEPLVDQLDDSNPKKWYLKGILWADEAGQEPPVGASSNFRELTDAEYLHLQRTDPEALQRYQEEQRLHDEATAAARADKTPYFLAYFQHSFDLEPRFKRLYFSEGNVDDERRKSHPYRNKDIEAYRKKFNLLYAAEQKAKANAPAADNQN